MIKSRNRAFTLIELLVVMAIVALLLTLALPRYFGSLDKSKDRVLEENLRVIRVTLDKFYADKGKYPDSLQDLVEHNYLRALPVDPVTESSQTWILISPTESDSGGIADIKSGASGNTKDGRAYESL